MPPADPESSEPAPIRPRADPPAPTPPVAPAGMADLLLLARAIMREGGGEAAPGSPPAAAPGRRELITPGQARGPLPKEQKKFFKLANPPAATPDATLTDPPPPAVESDAGNEGPPAGTTAAPPPPATPPEVRRSPRREQRRKDSFVEESRPPGGGGRRRSSSSRQRTVVLGVGALCTTSAFAAGLFFGWLTRPAAAGKASVGPTGNANPAAAPTPTLAARAMTPDANLRRALATIDEAEAAHAAGDWARMDVLLEQADREAGPAGVPGLLLRRAENAVRRGELNAANSLAQRTLETGEDVAKAYALRAVIAQRSRRPEVALTLLEAAGRADPCEGRYLFYQSQTLRNQGKLQEAAARLRRALNRVEDSTQADNYRYALRLTQIELREEDAFAEELARELAQPNPASDSLVVAAARDCQAGQFQSAGELLRRAFSQHGPGYAASRLGDVFFRRFADRPELLAFYTQYLPPPPAPPPAVTPPPPSPGSPATTGDNLMAPLFPGPETTPPAAQVPKLP